MEQAISISGTTGITARLAGLDTVQKLTTALAPEQASKIPIGVLITCETYDIRFSFDVDPVNSGSVLGHVLAVGQSLHLSNPRAVNGFRLINKTAGSAGLLQVTYEY